METLQPFRGWTPPSRSRFSAHFPARGWKLLNFPAKFGKKLSTTFPLISPQGDGNQNTHFPRIQFSYSSFPLISPQGDGNEVSLTARSWEEILFRSFPRKGMETTTSWLDISGERNSVLFRSFPRKGMETCGPQPPGRLKPPNLFRSFPRKGMETKDSRDATQGVYPFPLISPQGDGNPMYSFTSSAISWLFRSFPRKGMETDNSIWTKCEVTHNFSAHFPARGWKRREPGASSFAIFSFFSAHFPARGWKRCNPA